MWSRETLGVGSSYPTCGPYGVPPIFGLGGSGSPPPCSTFSRKSPRDYSGVGKSCASLDSGPQCSTASSQGQLGEMRSVDDDAASVVSSIDERNTRPASGSALRTALDQLSQTPPSDLRRLSTGSSAKSDADGMRRRPVGWKRLSLSDRSPSGWMTPEDLRERGLGQPWLRGPGLCTVNAQVDEDARNMCLLPTPRLRGSLTSSEGPSEKRCDFDTEKELAMNGQGERTGFLRLDHKLAMQSPPQMRGSSLWQRLNSEDAPETPQRAHPQLPLASEHDVGVALEQTPESWGSSPTHSGDAAGSAESTSSRRESVPAEDPLLQDLAGRLKTVDLQLGDLPQTEGELVQVLVELGYTSAVHRTKVRRSLAAANAERHTVPMETD